MSAVEAAVGVVQRCDHSQCGQASKPTGGHGLLSQQVAQQQPSRNAHSDLCRQQCPAPARDGRQRAQSDGRSHADIEHRQNRQRAAEQGAGKRAEELASIGREGGDQRAGQKRDYHHATGYPIQRALDSKLHAYLPFKPPQSARLQVNAPCNGATA